MARFSLAALAGDTIAPPGPAGAKTQRPVQSGATVGVRAPRINPPHGRPPGSIVALLGDARFRRVWLAGGLAGTIRWLEMLAIGVFVFQQTRSPSTVALMTFLRMAPMLLIGLPAGGIAERFDRKYLLFGGLLTLTLLSASLAALTLSGNLALWHIGVGAFASGVFWTMEFPVRRTMIGEIVGRERVAAAMGLEAATGNATRTLGPLLGGLLLELIGLQGAYLLGTLFYTVAAVLIWPLPYRAEAQSSDGGMLRGVAEGIAYAGRQRIIVATLLVTVAVNLFGFAYVSLVPVIGEATLGLSAFLIGVLMSAEGLGALTGSLLVGTLAKPWTYTRFYLCASFAFLAMLVLFALSRTFALSLLALFASGMGIAGFATMQSTIMFVVAPPAMRSRLMGVLSVCIGMGPIGMIHVGYLADLIGAAMAVLTIALEGLIALGLIAWLWPELWRGGALSTPGAQSLGATSSRATLPSSSGDGGG